MKVSVILPIYNGEKTIDATLKSLKEQTFQDFELIVCIDGTHDRSEDILKRYEDCFLKMIILKNRNNLGLGPTMNRLIANTSGEYIAIAEQDDYYYPNRLALQIDFLDQNPTYGLVSGIAEFWNGEKVTMLFPGILVNGGKYPEGKDLFILNYREQLKIVNSCIMLRKSVHIDNGLYFTKHYPSISVDWTYILRLSLVSKIQGLHEVLVRLDRKANRDSVTSDKVKQYLASRELLRSFAYEYPEIISKSDCKYAQTTQHLMELSITSKFKFVPTFIYFYFLNPQDTRWQPYFKKRIKRLFEKKII
ncbi:glycosyl transferase, family 2 [unidentified eubacterium SCB49]|nr:glycosyl transferase, family 2 [unidentified eubacterium SCB49]